MNTLWLPAIIASSAPVDAGGFDRLAISGLEAWYHAELSPLWQDAGTTPVGAADDPIYRVEDLSGNGRHLNVYGADNARRPLYKPAAQNGLAGIRFDGAGDSLTVDVAGWTQPIQIFIAYKSITVGAANANDVVLGSARGSGVDFSVATMPRTGLWTGQFISYAATIAYPDAAVVTIAYTSGGAAYIREDGVEMVAGSGGPHELLGLDVAALGGGRSTNIEVYEIIVVKPPLTGTGLSDVETALISEWGI